jgi:YVTN family beta-propeller protein
VALPLSAASVRILQTNSAGDDVTIIDPATNKVVGSIKGIEVNHGATTSPDGSRYYISNESRSTLEVVDTKTLKITSSIPLSGHPNNISISKDGKRVYVAIARAPGAVDVIDTVSLERVKTIPAKGPVHNTFVTPDGKWVVAGSVVGKNITVISQKTEDVVWTLDMGAGIRPMAFTTNPDGSTKWILVQLSDFNGFAVVDFTTHKEINRITLPELPAGKAKYMFGGSESHGMAVTPDQKTLVVNSRLNSSVYLYSLPDLKLEASIEVGKSPDWVTLTPDGKMAYVACAASDAVSVVDLVAKREVMKIPVGQVPKRNSTAILP